MATIRKTPLSPYWQAVITLTDGRRTNRSTKCTAKGDALLIAAQYQDIANKGREGTLTTEHAKKVLNDILQRSGQDSIHNDTAENYFRDWLKGKIGQSTRERYEVPINAFLAHLGAKSRHNLTSISHKDILSFIESRKKGGLAPKTISVDVKILKAALNTARKMGFIPDNPAEKALVLHPIDVESSERFPFKPEQVETLLSAAEGDWVTMILLGFCVGPRISDCADMEWSNTRFDRGVIDFIQEKKKRRKKHRRVVCPLHPMLEAHLRKLWNSQTKHAVHLCPTLAALKSGGKTGLSERFLQLMAKAGIDPQKVQGKGKRMFHRLTFHSLRHCFNSELANKGVSQELRMKLTGHSNVDVNDDYTHFDIPALKQAINILPMLNYVSKDAAAA